MDTSFLELELGGMGTNSSLAPAGTPLTLSLLEELEESDEEEDEEARPEVAPLAPRVSLLGRGVMMGESWEEVEREGEAVGTTAAGTGEEGMGEG